MTMNSSLTYDASVIGQEVEVASFEVTAEQIKAYCEAIGETSPLYTDEAVAKDGPYAGIIAPPGLVLTITLAQGPNANVKFGNTAFHGGERIEPLGTIRVGDRLTAMTHVKEVYEKTGRTGGMAFEVRRTVWRNQDSEPVVATESTLVRREV
jgi:acyl dehydratase